MDSKAYLRKMAAARAKRSETTSEAAYAQVDRMMKTTNGPFTTKASAVSSDGPKKENASSKDSSR